MSVRLQTDFSFEEEHRKLLKREAKMQEDAEKKMRQLRKDVKEEEVMNKGAARPENTRLPDTWRNAEFCGRGDIF